MTPLSAALTWLGLAIVIGVELILCRFEATRGILPYLGIGMAIVVSLTFMRLGSGRGLVPVFALAGAFWLCILLGLGSLDSFTRHDVPVFARTTP